MSYFDHVLMFASEDEAKATLVDYVVDGEWVGSVIPNLSVTIPTGEDTSITIPGFFINIAKHDVDQSLIDLPNETCRLVSDREAASNNENFFIYVVPSLDLKLLSTGVVSPVFMGSEYPFCDNKENQTRPE